MKDLLKSAALNDRDHGDFAPSQMVIELCSTFNNSNFEDKKSFFLYIVNELGVNHDSIKEICTEMDKLDSQQRDEKAFFLLEKKLKQALTPPYENVCMVPYLICDALLTSICIDIFADHCSKWRVKAAY